jgi:ethanolamine ammonia-lyase large subunit
VAPGIDSRHNLIVRFRPNATEEDIRHVLRDTDAKLVYGPTITDAYVLTVPASDEKTAVVRLRGNSAVLLVESLDGQGMP